MRACSNLSWQVPDVSLIGSTSNFNLSGGEGGSEAITIAVAVSVLVLLGFCCCWFWYAFRAGKPCCCWSCGCFWFECACRAGLPSDDPAEKNTVFVFAKPHANTPAVLEVIRTKFTEQGIKVLQEGVVTGEEIESKGFMDQHDKFTSPGSSIHYYVVEFNPATLSWADFRGKVLGLTTPADAPTDSLRGIVAANWQKLGLQAPCDDSDNAVHASASPFESLAERTNWFACCVSDDPFGSALLAKGVPEATIKKWSNDPQVKYDDETAKEKGMSKGSIFDALKDLDYKQCLDRCVAINKASAEVLVYQKALDAVNEASKEGADWVKGLNPLVAAVQLAKAKQPARRAFLGAPTNGSYALVTEMGTPPDADCSERARDKVLGFFIAQNTLFMVLAGFCALIIVGFGVAIGVFLLSAIIGVEIFTLSDIYPDCANKTHSIELYLERNPGKFWTERDGVYAPATHNKVDRVFGQGMHKVCTDGQLWFNICIKVFIIVFSYINLLPVPWRFAILCDAYDTDNRNKGQVGVDFYGRPTEALWFHLPVHTRKIVAWCLNIGYVAHYVSLGTHIYYWEYWDTQGMPGAPAVNIPFIISIVVPIIGAQFQGAAEKTVMKANPKRFPPTFYEYLAKAKADYAEDLRTGKATRLGCGLGFLKHVLKSQEQMKKDQEEFETLSGVKSSKMAGIMLTKDSKSPSPKTVAVPNSGRSSC